jgi:hypothetical protein
MIFILIYDIHRETCVFVLQMPKSVFLGAGRVGCPVSIVLQAEQYVYFDLEGVDLGAFWVSWPEWCRETGVFVCVISWISHALLRF